nr:hypothetical protein [Tanacetum cinerariifolium]
CAPVRRPGPARRSSALPSRRHRPLRSPPPPPRVPAPGAACRAAGWPGPRRRRAAPGRRAAAPAPRRRGNACRRGLHGRAAPDRSPAT